MTVIKAKCKSHDEWIKLFSEVRPSGGFKVILIDPPWPWAARSDKGMGKSPEMHYSTMSVDKIADIPVRALAANDAVVFMWATWPLMPVWADVINQWGFKYASLAWEWVKYNPETGKHAFGPGYGTRKNLEPCLMATVGAPQMRKTTDFFGTPIEPQGVRSVRDFIEWCPLDHVRSPRREHSQKPDEQYSRIETMFDGPYCEVFARQSRSGWTSIGNEVDKFQVERTI